MSEPSITRARAPGPALGTLVGALVTAPLIAVLYLARQIAGVPFVPNDVFDGGARRLPGSVITFGIDRMVAAIRALRLGKISDAAKTRSRPSRSVVFSPPASSPVPCCSRCCSDVPACRPGSPACCRAH